MSKITLNTERELYVIENGNGYTCLGFDVCEKRAEALAKELIEIGSLWQSIPAERGTIERYTQYQELCKIASELNQQTGWRSASELTPELIGLEGKRVEVIDCYGEKRRFYVGKSTGFIPCHLEIKRVDSTGGGAVSGAPFKSVRVLDKARY